MYRYSILTTAAAALSHRLGVLAKRVTWDDVGDNTDPKIIKTTEQTIAPVPGHFVSSHETAV